MYTEGSVPLCVMTHDKRDRSALPLATEGTQEMTASFFLPQRGERKKSSPHFAVQRGHTDLLPPTYESYAKLKVIMYCINV